MGIFGKVAAGAFLGGLADEMKENREWAREKAAKTQEYLYERGLQRRQEVAKARNALTSSVDYLRSKELDDRAINALLLENPTELIRLAQTAQQAEVDGTLTKAVLNKAVEVASDFETDLTASDLIKQATPEFIDAEDPVKPDVAEKSFLQNMFGRPDVSEVLYDVYKENLLGDTSGADIMASLSEPVVKRRAEDATTKIDLSKLAGKYDTKFKREIQTEIHNKYDEFLQMEKQRLGNMINDPNFEMDEEEKEKKMRDYNKLIEIDNIKDNDFEKYYQLIQINPNIAMNLYNLSPGYAATLGDDTFFKVGTIDLITSD